MKSFILKTIILLLTLTTLFFFILLRADGATDPFYLRFTTPKKTNLILGTSKSAQGLQPSVIQKKINGNFFNYSFTDAHSPFGPVYLKSIKKKLNRDTMDGIFIVTVDPWSISSRTKNPNDIENFRENNLSLAQTKYVNIYPNCEYLIENFKGKYYKILTTSSNTMFLHSNGWLEVSVPMDSISVKKRLNNKLETYKREMLPSYKFSSVRLGYLKKQLNF